MNWVILANILDKVNYLLSFLGKKRLKKNPRGIPKKQYKLLSINYDNVLALSKNKMTKKVKDKKGLSTKAVLGIGAGVAALSAAAYILFGPNGKKNQKAIKGWTVKMKGEIIEKFENAKELTEPVYHNIIDGIQAKYAKIKNVDPKELENVITEIKKHWKALQKEVGVKKSKTAKKK